MEFLQVVTDPGISLDKPKGATQHVLGVRRAIERLGHGVRLLATAPGSLEDRERVIRIPVGSTEAGDRFLAAENWLAEIASDAPQRFGRVDVVLERLGLYPGSARILAARLGALHVLEVNAPLAEEAATYRGLDDGGLAENRERQALRATDLVVTVSRSLTSRARSLRDDPSAVLHLPNGVDTSRFLARDAERNPRRIRLGVSPNTCVVAFVSTFKPWHGASRLLDAFEAARASGADLHLLLIGDGPERAALRARIARMRERAAITDLGTVTADEVPSWLAAADVGAAFYSQNSGFYFSPLKVAEYAAAGLAIARSRQGDMEDMVPEGESSLAVESDDVEGFAELLVRLARDVDLRDGLSRAARERAVQRLDWGSKMRELVTHIESVREIAIRRPAAAT